MDGCRVQRGMSGTTPRFLARRRVALSFTKWRNTGKRLELGGKEKCKL